jgi:hypothetical protein
MPSTPNISDAIISHILSAGALAQYALADLRERRGAEAHAAAAHDLQHGAYLQVLTTVLHVERALHVHVLLQRADGSSEAIAALSFEPDAAPPGMH